MARSTRSLDTRSQGIVYYSQWTDSIIIFLLVDLTSTSQRAPSIPRPPNSIRYFLHNHSINVTTPFTSSWSGRRWVTDALDWCGLSKGLMSGFPDGSELCSGACRKWRDFSLFISPSFPFYSTCQIYPKKSSTPRSMNSSRYFIIRSTSPPLIISSNPIICGGVLPRMWEDWKQV